MAIYANIMAHFARCFAHFATFKNVQGIVTMPRDIDFSTYLGKSWQNKAIDTLIRSRNVVKIKCVTIIITLLILLVPLHNTQAYLMNILHDTILFLYLILH